MKVTLMQKLKEAIAKLLKKSAEKDYDENSFWSNPKRRKAAMIVIAGALIVVASSMMPEQKVRAKRTKSTYELAIDDISGQSNKPTTVFSEGGADKLDQVASADLLKAMETEMQAREEQLQQDRKIMAKEKQAKDNEMDAALMKMSEVKRETDAKHKNELNQLKEQNTKTIQNVVDALANGQDISKIAPGVNVPVNPFVSHYRNTANSNVVAANSKPQQNNNNLGLVYNGSNTNSAQQARQNPRYLAQSGIRVMTSTSSMRVATGQMIDLDENSMDAKGSPKQLETVFERLELAKAELRAKQQAARVETEARNQQIKQEEIRASNRVPLTAGSIISGTLMSGMYVPTSSSASSNPIPGIFRIKREALMPNFNVSEEVKECVIIAAGRPVIEATRVDFRANTITCIRDDGTATEDSIQAIASGRDGSTGVPATLISRNGEVLAKTAAAGFLQSLTDLFSQTAIEVNSDDGVYAISGSQAAQLTGSAALGGAGKALEKLADYYMSIADKMQPTLKVSPGIEVDFIVTRMSILDFNTDSTKKPVAQPTPSAPQPTTTANVRK